MLASVRHHNCLSAVARKLRRIQASLGKFGPKRRQLQARRHRSVASDPTLVTIVEVLRGSEQLRGNDSEESSRAYHIDHAARAFSHVLFLGGRTGQEMDFLSTTGSGVSMLGPLRRPGDGIFRCSYEVRRGVRCGADQCLSSAILSITHSLLNPSGFFPRSECLGTCILFVE